ncbi:hypothetical protein F66182_4262 [Fusarium sp. NRRL 66182]|nr:hypothetical protein F66182_4262 [Fusarium sp. NRRL 66182]
MPNVLRSRRPTSGPKAGEYAEASPQHTFMSLPTEIHVAISRLLIYPDALSLKHTNAHFYSLVDTGINLKVEWLVERRSLHLEYCSCGGGESTSNVNPAQVLDALSMGPKHAPIAPL